MLQFVCYYNHTQYQNKQVLLKRYGRITSQMPPHLSMFLMFNFGIGVLHFAMHNH